jgi:hypothetical protein
MDCDALTARSTLEMAYLLLMAPFLMVVLAFRAHRTRHASRIHAAIFWSAAAYVPLVGLTVAIVRHL